jgi:PAS domain S-box-containing protein
MKRTLPAAALESVLDALVEPVKVTDADGTVVFTNAAGVRQFGWDKCVGLPLGERVARLHLFHADGRPMSEAEYPVTRVLRTGEAVLGAILYIESEDHGRRAYSMNAVPLRDGGRLVGTVSVLHDVTEPIRLERELGEHVGRLEAIVNLVSDGIIVTGADGTLVFANAIGQRYLGVGVNTSLEERGRRIELRTADGRRLAAEQYPSARALRGETVAGTAAELTSAAGERRLLIISAHPLRRPDGAIYGSLITMNDVTEEARAREELEAARTRAEEASRMKDQFIAALSHELRAPLQPILGWTEVLRRHGHLDDITVRALEAIRRNIRQQVRLVDDLLDLSRIVHRKLALRYETFDLREQVRGAAEPFEETAALKRLRFSIALPPEPLHMWGDGSRVQQIATNLISNAVKFTPAGGRVSVRLGADAGDAVLEVEDTGEGIAPDDLPFIFDVFRQGSRARPKGGLGIGLDLVKRLTEMHGGAVEAFSEGQGRGARFVVRLPLVQLTTRPLAAGVPATRRLDQRSILIIEDNADTRDVMKFMLELEGAHVHTADCGESGVRAVDRVAPSVVLCDIGLPDIDGLEVARRIRQQPALAGVRLIALTGYGQAEDLKRAIEAGFDAHLTKPVNLDELLDLLSSS